MLVNSTPTPAVHGWHAPTDSRCWQTIRASQKSKVSATARPPGGALWARRSLFQRLLRSPGSTCERIAGASVTILGRLSKLECWRAYVRARRAHREGKAEKTIHPRRQAFAPVRCAEKCVAPLHSSSTMPVKVLASAGAPQTTHRSMADPLDRDLDRRVGSDRWHRR
jgi:hypothetical protein